MGFVVVLSTVHLVMPGVAWSVTVFHVFPIMSMPQFPAPMLHELTTTASTAGPMGPVPPLPVLHWILYTCPQIGLLFCLTLRSISAAISPTAIASVTAYVV